jgi:hypothetical protein
MWNLPPFFSFLGFPSPALEVMVLFFSSDEELLVERRGSFL